VSSAASQAGKFGLVGLVSTLIDFSILNIVHSGFSVNLIIANIISTTIAMGFSFLMNRKYVFTGGTKSILHQTVAFLLVTSFGLYVIQSVVLHLLTVTWTGPANLVVYLIGAVGLSQVIGKNFIITNFAKIIATMFSLVWNYVFYRRVVFI
jgi:putative flippase GtrA